MKTALYVIVAVIAYLGVGILVTKVFFHRKPVHVSAAPAVFIAPFIWPLLVPIGIELCGVDPQSHCHLCADRLAQTVQEPSARAGPSRPLQAMLLVLGCTLP